MRRKSSEIGSLNAAAAVEGEILPRSPQPKIVSEHRTIIDDKGDVMKIGIIAVSLNGGEMNPDTLAKIAREVFQSLPTSQEFTEVDPQQELRRLLEDSKGRRKRVRVRGRAKNDQTPK